MRSPFLVSSLPRSTYNFWLGIEVPFIIEFTLDIVSSGYFDTSSTNSKNINPVFSVSFSARWAPFEERPKYSDNALRLNTG